MGPGRQLLESATSFNWFLIVICVVVGLLTLALSLYLLVIFQHPEDRNQAWLPKIVVVTGLSLAIYTVLLFPLDVANSESCSLDVAINDCTSTLPMEALWYACYIAICVYVFALIPFFMFYYEGDSEWCDRAACGRRRQPRHGRPSVSAHARPRARPGRCGGVA